MLVLRHAHDCSYSRHCGVDEGGVRQVAFFESHAAIATASGIEPRTIKLLRAPRSVRATTRTELHQPLPVIGPRFDEAGPGHGRTLH